MDSAVCCGMGEESGALAEETQQPPEAVCWGRGQGSEGGGVRSACVFVHVCAEVTKFLLICFGVCTCV